jgi:hypothetical protein
MICVKTCEDATTEYDICRKGVFAMAKWICPFAYGRALVITIDLCRGMIKLLFEHK